MADITVTDKNTKKRFKSGIEAQKQLLDITRVIQSAILNYLPSNYSKDQNTNLSEFFRAVSKEFARLQVSGSDINENKYDTQTQAEYLFQILGDSLFLGSKSINENLSDVAYRNFLIRVRNAYFGGSRKENIESAISDIVGLPVILKEVYLDLRKEGSSYSLKDTNKMFFDIIMDEVTSSSSVGLILEDLKFFIDIIKPSHVIYDTRLIWNEEFGNRPAECKPSYITENMEYEVYGTSRIDLITYLSSSIYKFLGGDPETDWISGTIATIDINRGIFYLTDRRILVYNNLTRFYYRDSTGDHATTSSYFNVGDEIKYYATVDSASSSDVIKSDWGYTGIIDNIYESDNIISLADGSLIVYNSDTLVYTRDKDGEYRIDLSDLLVNREIVFKADKYIRSFQFYRTPEEVQNNFFKQFDSNVIAKPSFDEYVKKNKDIPEGVEEGYDVIVEDGIVKVVKIYSPFYKRDGTENYKESKIHNYSLYIGDEFQRQFHISDANRALTENEAKSVFINTYGYTGLLENPDYRIDIATTGRLMPDGRDAILQAIGTQTQFCDRRAMCQFLPFYEDTRKYFTWPDIQLTSGFFRTEFSFPDINPPEDAKDLPAWFYLSSDPNIYRMPLLPMLGPDGEPAEVSDLVVYLNGRLIEDAVESIDPWSGVVGLNFIPPFDTTLRIDYYYSGRYPRPVYYLKQIVFDTVQVIENDLAGLLSVVNTGGEVRRLTWPFEVSDPSLYGDDRDYQVNKFPILTQRGKLATKNDIDVYVGTVIAKGDLQLISVTDTQSVLQSVGIDLTSVTDGDTVILKVINYLDSTYIYIIDNVSLIDNTITVSSVMPGVGEIHEAVIVHFIEVADAVDDVRPLLGHVRLNFLPPLNSFIKFNYYYTPYERNYLMIPDRDEVVNPDLEYGSSSYTPDTVYGSKSNYTMLVDQSSDYTNIPYRSFDQLLKIGYRYRAFKLAHTNALNSEQMILNDYDKYKNRASFANRNGVLNRFDLMYSPEFLYDTDKHVILNDKYLHKDLTPQIILNPGVPLFEDTFTDDGHYVRSYQAHEHYTFDPNLVGGMDLQAGFTIIDSDNSGIIDSNGVCEYKDKKKINLYSDLKVVEHSNDGYDAHLITIDDGSTSLPFRFTFIDQYYPDRELRLSDYLDYINQVPTEYRTGSIKVLRGSSVIKSIERNFKVVNVGDMFTIKNVPYEFYTGMQYKDVDYTIVKVVDFETAVIHKDFDGPSGSYDYDLTRSKTYAVDTYLSKVNRTLVLNGDLNHTYSLPLPVLQALPGYGVTGVHFELYFPDPDPDPYPRNPDNPWIPNPTGIVYYSIPEVLIDNKIYRTNRTKGVTGIVLTSQIIDAEGNSVGYTGYATGVTGPSGALDLGITGPVGYPNPRILEECDVYQIPSGESGVYLSYSEAEYRVQWRNWDQDIMIVTLGVSGIISEEPVNLMNDVGDGIKLCFWSVANAQIRDIRFSGSVVTTSEEVFSSVLASSYPQGLILITQDEEDRIQAAMDPVTELPTMHLADTNYKLHRMIVREIMQDGLVNITEIQRFIPI